MIYIGENNKEVASISYDSMQQHIFEFHTDKLDYYLNVQINWDIIEGDVYDMKIGDGVFSIPSGMFVMIGDEYGEIDWIKIDELIARPIQVATLDIDFVNWEAKQPQVISIGEDGMYWPATKHVIPIQSNGVVVLVSEKDQHLNLQDYQIEVFTQVE